MTKKKKSRKKIRAELKNVMFDNIETRKSRFKPESNRYELQLEEKKREKKIRDDVKRNKFHIKNRRILKNRWKAEGELEQEEDVIEFKENVKENEEDVLEFKEDLKEREGDSIEFKEDLVEHNK